MNIQNCDQQETKLFCIMADFPLICSQSNSFSAHYILQFATIYDFYPVSVFRKIRFYFVLTYIKRKTIRSVLMLISTT